MSTTGDCTASCCAGSNSAQEVGDSKKKSNNQNGKRNLGGFLDLNNRSDFYTYTPPIINQNKVQTL